MMTTRMAHESPITDELRVWLRTQLAGGCSVEDVLASMRNSGWSAAAAERAVREVQPEVVLPVEVPAPVMLPTMAEEPLPMLGVGVAAAPCSGS